LPEGSELWDDLVAKSSREYEGKRGHVLRTIKLRGQVSQGWCIPLDTMDKHFPAFREARIAAVAKLPEYPASAVFQELSRIDFAESIGVLKYEAPIPAELAGQVKGLFPSFIKKTDQERCQNLGAEIFADLDVKYEVTIKLDGTSMTVYHYNSGDADGEITGVGGVCSRNLDLKIGEENKDNTMVKIANSGLIDRLKKYPNTAVQGELMGPSIQGNREQLKAPKFFVFDIFDISAGEYYSPERRLKFVMDNADIGVDLIHHVPVIHHSISLRELGITNVDELLQFAEGKSLKHDVREGVVFKRADGKFSFKAISNKFLLKQKE
jgi:RNA ligase (TIGR02306 family)